MFYLLRIKYQRSMVMFRLANGFDECSPLLSAWGKHTRHFARCRNGHTDLQTCLFFVHKLSLDQGWKRRVASLSFWMPQPDSSTVRLYLTLMLADSWLRKVLSFSNTCSIWLSEAKSKIDLHKQLFAWRRRVVIASHWCSTDNINYKVASIRSTHFLKRSKMQMGKRRQMHGWGLPFGTEENSNIMPCDYDTSAQKKHLAPSHSPIAPNETIRLLERYTAILSCQERMKHPQQLMLSA